MVSSPASKIDFEKYYALRYEVLRKPWGQAPGSERDAPADQTPGGLRDHHAVGAGEVLDPAGHVRRIAPVRVARRPLARAQRPDHETRALSVAIPVSAYI